MAGQINTTYNYPSGTNIGKISSQTDAISGKTVTYAYSLNRLLSASGSGWTDTYAYDGFGNLTTKTPTDGAPQLSVGVNPANNQVVGQNYDAKGNQQSYNGISLLYDAKNRLLSAVGLTDYLYDSQSKRRGVVLSGHIKKGPAPPIALGPRHSPRRLNRRRFFAGPDDLAARGQGVPSFVRSSPFFEGRQIRPAKFLTIIV